MKTLIKKWFTIDPRYGGSKFYRVFYLKPHHKFCDLLAKLFKNNSYMLKQISKFRYYYLHLGK